MQKSNTYSCNSTSAKPRFYHRHTHYVIDNLAGANDPTLKFGNKLSYDTSILKMDHNEKDYDPSSIVLGVLRKMSRLRYWDVTSLSVQLKNTTRNI